jgi:nucleotide-binding universal stress UspA family protein
MYDDVLYPTDGSEGSEAALDHALDVADRYGARLHVLYVADTARDSVTVVGGEVVDALEEHGEEVVGAAADRARDRGLRVFEEVLQGDPVATIVDYAEHNGVDLVVMGTRGREGVGEKLLGSVTDRVIRTGSVPVLAVQLEE